MTYFTCLCQTFNRSRRPKVAQALHHRFQNRVDPLNFSVPLEAVDLRKIASE